MTRIIEIAQQYADGLITATEFRDHLVLQLMNTEDEHPLFLLCTLLLRTEAVQ